MINRFMVGMIPKSIAEVNGDSRFSASSDQGQRWLIHSLQTWGEGGRDRQWHAATWQVTRVPTKLLATNNAVGTNWLMLAANNTIKHKKTTIEVPALMFIIR